MDRRRFLAATAGAALVVPARALARRSPTPDIPHSRGLGITLGEWTALHGKPTRIMIADTIYEMDAAGFPYEIVLYISKDTEQIHDIDVNFAQPPTANSAALITTALLPVDTVQTGQLVPDPTTIVNVAHSEWLAGSQRAQDGDPLWPNAQPGDFIVALSAPAGTLATVSISLGNDPTVYGG